MGQRWLFQLGGWLEPGQEGVVLCPEADGLPGDFVRTLRLRRWVFELGGWMECRQEGVVLHQQEDGVQGEAWRLNIPRLTVADCLFQARVWQSYSRALHKQTVTADVRRTTK